MTDIRPSTLRADAPWLNSRSQRLRAPLSQSRDDTNAGLHERSAHEPSCCARYPAGMVQGPPLCGSWRRWLATGRGAMGWRSASGRWHAFRERVYVEMCRPRTGTCDKMRLMAQLGALVPGFLAGVGSAEAVAARWSGVRIEVETMPSEFEHIICAVDQALDPEGARSRP